MKTNSWHWYRILIIVIPVIVILAVLLVLQPWNSSPKTQIVLAKAEAAIAKIQSYRFSGSDTSLSSNGAESHQDIEAEFEAPDIYQVKDTEDEQTNEFIIDGDKQYVNGNMSPPEILGFKLTFSSLLSKETTLRYLDYLTDIQRLPDEKIEGISCFHYEGKWNVDKVIADMKSSLIESDAKAGITPDRAEVDKQLDSMRSLKLNLEVWISKVDYFIMQMKTNEQIPGNEAGTEFSTVRATWKCYDFNQPLTIEAPLDSNGNLLPGWNLAGSITPDSKLPVFTAGVTSTIGAQPGYDDPAHQQISYHIAITNQSSETVEDVRVMLSTMATNDQQKPLVIEGQPETAGHVEFTPGDSETYNIAWNYDGSQNTKEEIIDLARQTTITVEFTTQDSRILTQSLLPENTSTPAPSSGAAGE